MKILLFLLLTPFAAAQTWFKVVPENGTATLPAGATYQYGSGVKFCDAVKVTVSTTVTAANGGTCKVNGVVTADPDPNVVKELDVQEQAASFVVPVVINGVKSNVTVPALPAPPPPPPPVSTTITLTCTSTSTVIITTPASGSPVTVTAPLNFSCVKQ